MLFVPLRAVPGDLLGWKKILALKRGKFSPALVLLDRYVMASTVLLLAVLILAILLLILISAATSVAAYDVQRNGANYVISPKLRAAHRYLTIASAVGWAALFALVVICLTGWHTGTLTIPIVTTDFLTNQAVSNIDLAQAHTTADKITGTTTTGYVVLVTLVAVCMIVFAAALLCVLAAGAINGVTPWASYAGTAYTYSIIGAVASLAGLAAMVVAIVTYLGIRAHRADCAQELQTFLQRNSDSTRSSGLAEVQPDPVAVEA